MKIKEKKPVLFVLLFSGFVLAIFLIMQPLEIRYGGELIGVLFPKGNIAIKQRNLLLIIQVIMLFIVIPVYILTYVFSWKYHARNSKEKYEPDWEESRLAEYLWWGIPFVIVLAIGILTVVRTYHLDPYKPLVSDKKPITIQVVALQWKWLFIYPEEKIASLNFFQFPEKTPLHFEITSDAPMNSFWIPQLGGQIYAMPKMKTELYLIADEVGEFRGSSANISGEGFASMHFIAKASTDEEFQQWVKSAQQSSQILTFEEYNKIALPSQNDPVTIYQLKEENLFHQIIMKYMPQKKSQPVSEQVKTIPFQELSFILDRRDKTLINERICLVN